MLGTNFYITQAKMKKENYLSKILVFKVVKLFQLFSPQEFTLLGKPRVLRFSSKLHIRGQTHRKIKDWKEKTRKTKFSSRMENEFEKRLFENKFVKEKKLSNVSSAATYFVPVATLRGAKTNIAIKDK